MRNMKKKGFTLVELLVVIAIIAILATVSVVGYTAFINRANESNAMTEAAQVEEAIKANLMAGEDYVIGTVQSAEAVAKDVTKTTYFVDADDNKIYTSTITCTEVDANGVATWGDAVVSEDEFIGDLTAAFDANPDFEALKGTFEAKANGVIIYTYEGDTTATIDLN